MNKIEMQLERLAALSPADLRLTWQETYGEAAPLLSPMLLRLGIAYRWQEKSTGKLPARQARRLTGGQGAGPSIRLTPGTQLVRSWNDRTISVAVTSDGFVYEERSYRSLSAIAREVTGTQWSGPRFFGLQESMRG